MNEFWDSSRLGLSYRMSRSFKRFDLCDELSDLARQPLNLGFLRFKQLLFELQVRGSSLAIILEILQGNKIINNFSGRRGCQAWQTRKSATIGVPNESGAHANSGQHDYDNEDEGGTTPRRLL